MAIKYDIKDYLKRILDKAKDVFLDEDIRTVSVQGEIFGEGIQKNPLKQAEKDLILFNVNVNQYAVPRNGWEYLIPDTVIDKIRFVPLFDFKLPTTMDGIINQAEGLKSLINPEVQAEGIVWRDGERSEPIKWEECKIVSSASEDGSEVFVECIVDHIAASSFKIINNKYLLKNEG
jgi:hypothetical protein